VSSQDGRPFSDIPERAGEPPSFDTTVSHPARTYDYWLGGKDNYEIDRDIGDQVIAAMPSILHAVRANRAFLRRAVQYLADEAGIRQFLDIGTGLPTNENTHEVAQRAAPQSRIVYVDNDPIVLVHARALLDSTRRAPPPTSRPTPATPARSCARPRRRSTSASPSLS